MLSKHCNQLLLCFLLAGPVVLPVWSAENAQRTDGRDVAQVERSVDASTSRSSTVAVKVSRTGSQSARGGQAAPSPASGGISGSEQVSRLIVEGRRAFHDGDYDLAGARFSEALRFDAENQEARKFLEDIGRLKSAAQLKPAVEASAGASRLLPRETREVQPVPIHGGSAAAMTVAGGQSASSDQQVVLALGGRSGPDTNATSLGAKAVKQSLQRASLSVASNGANMSLGRKDASAIDDAKSAEEPTVDGQAPRPEPESPNANKKQESAAKEEKKDVAAAKSPAEPVLPFEEIDLLPGLSSLKASNKAPAKLAMATKPSIPTLSPQSPPKPVESSSTKSEAVSAKGKETVSTPARGEDGPWKTEADSVVKSQPSPGAQPADKPAAKASLSPKEETSRGSVAAVPSSEGAPEGPRNAASKSEPSAKTEKSAGDEARKRASELTDEGIALYNAGNYTEALEKFTNALVSDSTYGDAQQYKGRTIKRLESRQASESRLLAQVPQPTPAVAPTVAQAKDADGTALPSLSSAMAKEEEKPDDTQKAPAPKEPASAKTEGKADSKVEADKFVRQAQRELSIGKKDDALNSARSALLKDPDNAEAKSLVAELEGGQATSSVSKQTPVGVDGLLSEGKNQFDAGKVDLALRTFRSVLESDPNNETARRYVSQIEEARSIQKSQSAQVSANANSDQAEASFQKGLAAYQAGSLDTAVQWWNYSLTVNPGHQGALQYLQQTRGEYDAWAQQHQYNAVQMQKEAAANEKLDSAVTYDTAGSKSIVEFLSAMSLITDISFYVSDGVDPEIRINGKFEEQPLAQVLDTVLLPIGLKWSRTGDVVTVTSDLRTKFFNLTPEQVSRLKSLLESKTLQRILYGPEGTPAVRNVELTLDDRENILLVKDTQENIGKVEAFLKDMQLTNPPGLVYKNWKIRPEEGQKIKALVEAIVKVQSDAPYDLERKVVVDGEDLIVKDTAENVARIEQLLLDKNFLRKLEQQKLSVSTFNLTPREPITENLEQVRELAQNVVTVVKTILYAQSTESAAASEGRRYWYDPNTLQLTICDYPENLRVVSDYIRSLPTMGRKQKSEIVFLKHQTAADAAELLNRVLGLTAADFTGQATGQSVTKTLRVEGELTFRDLRIRVTRINENDVADDNDDSVELVIRTPTTSEDRTIEEFRSEFIDDYEVNVIEVRPSGQLGEGSARVEVRYSPTATGVTTLQPTTLGVQPGLTGVPGAYPGTVGAPGILGAPGTGGILGVEQPQTQIDTIENMNALLIRYEDPGDYAEIKGWIDQLDIPVLQVDIETKMVEVNETRAKEYMPEFNILNLGKQGIDTANSELDMRFANDIDEFRNMFEPFADDPFNAGLLKGTTVFNFIAPGETPLAFTLRMLEAEGVVNVVNGPHVVVENGETADFEIEKRFGGLPQVQIGTGGTATTQGFIQSLQQVTMSVSPRITQLGEIRLEIQDLELQDFGNDSGAIATVDVNNNAAADNFEPSAIVQSLNYDVRRKSLQTVARVHNGGTIVLGGWSGERTRESDSGVPILRNLPCIGKLLFSRTSDKTERTTLLIFLTCHLVEP